MKLLKKSQVRSEEDNRNLRESVTAIINDVRKNGDAALRQYNEKFDGCNRDSIRVSKEEIEAAYRELSVEEINDLRAAYKNIRSFAEAQRETVKPLEGFSPEPGIFLGHRIIPVSYTHLDNRIIE